MLVAQDSTAYGEDRGERDGLAVLLERLAEAVPEVPWIRLMYAYPGRVTPRLAETMARLPNVVPYLDIPLQHGSPSALKRMRRPSLRVARRSLDAVRERCRTSLCGRPSSWASPARRRRSSRSCSTSWGSNASTMSAHSPTRRSRHARRDLGDAVPHELATERYGRLMELAQRISLERNRELVGRELDVLVESATPAEGGDGQPIAVGRTYRDAPEVDGLTFLRGEFPAGALVRARVEGALPYDLVCAPLAEPVEA